MRAIDKRIRAINEYARQLEAKWEKKDTVVSRWSPVVRTTRKHQFLHIESTSQRLADRVKQCAQIVSSGSSTTGCSVIALTHESGKFRLVTFIVSFEFGNDFKQAYLLFHRLSQAVISRHAIERWLERNDSDDVEAALFDLGKSMANSSLKMMILTKESENTSFEHLTEYEAICESGGMAIIKTNTPEDDSLITREFTLVTYLSADQLGHWNRDEIDSELQTVISDYEDL